VVGDCKCDQFYQAKVCTERGEDCDISSQISCRPYPPPDHYGKERIIFQLFQNFM